MSSNNQSNTIIKWLVVFSDFVLLNAIILVFYQWHDLMSTWDGGMVEVFILVNNIALILAQIRFSTVIHFRVVGAGEFMRRMVGLACLQSLLAFVLLRIFAPDLPLGWLQVGVGIAFFLMIVVKRLSERWFIKLYREAGRNTRSVTLVGNDPELLSVYEKLQGDATLGYKILGYYADTEMGEWTYPMDDSRRKMADEKGLTQDEQDDKKKLKHLGTLQDFLRLMREDSDQLELGDEMYVSVSRRDKDAIKRISRFCDSKLIRFYYVPVSVESIGLSLKREMLDDMEVFTTYENPLQNPVNRLIKRLFDVILSILFLIPTAIIFPFIFIIMKIQSPGPILFKQQRTGLDGKTFNCYKFRSMHVNADADKVQATKDDPRKYPFGNFMRKSNIDELPQFINVLQGRMSIVGPRPHMLVHTEQYSGLIDKYMVRHFVKPGVTGWAQVTGFRGETKELWQMEGRVKRDIWYIENWSIWLDIRIIWLTFKSMFIHDKNAY